MAASTWDSVASGFAVVEAPQNVQIDIKTSRSMSISYYHQLGRPAIEDGALAKQGMRVWQFPKFISNTKVYSRGKKNDIMFPVWVNVLTWMAPFSTKTRYLLTTELSLSYFCCFFRILPYRCDMLYLCFLHVNPCLQPGYRKGWSFAWASTRFLRFQFQTEVQDLVEMTKFKQIWNLHPKNIVSHDFKCTTSFLGFGVFKSL